MKKKKSTTEITSRSDAMSDETDSDTVCIVAVSYLRFHPGPAGRGKTKARGEPNKQT